LKEKGLKLTPQRRLILDAIDEADAHLTAEELIAHVEAIMPEVHKSTIYRTLQLLERTGCLFKSDLDGHGIYHHAEEANHHHLVCSKCGKTIECDKELFATVEKSIAENYHFSVNFKHLVMSGLCEDCTKEND
jgi:Fur family ferric uptake transcriptional regulator